MRHRVPASASRPPPGSANLSPSFARVSSSFFAASFCPSLTSARARLRRIAGGIRARGPTAFCSSLDAARGVALLDQQHAKRVENRGVVRRELVGLLRVFDRLRILELAGDPGEVVERQRIVRLELRASPCTAWPPPRSPSCRCAVLRQVAAEGAILGMVLEPRRRQSCRPRLRCRRRAAPRADRSRDRWCRPASGRCDTRPRPRSRPSSTRGCRPRGCSPPDSFGRCFCTSRAAASASLRRGRSETIQRDRWHAGLRPGRA